MQKPKSSLSLWPVILVALAAILPEGIAQTDVLTVQVGVPASPPIAIVQHGDLWRYRKGTSEPPVDWHSVTDETLDASWESGPGGIGFADGDDGTVLTDMRNNYLTVYIRQSFEITEPVDSEAHLQLTVDWDDGYVAYLDGIEISRSSNVPFTPHPFDQGVVPDHPAVVDGGALGVYDLGPVGDRLSVGTHILALQGINGDIGSSDLTLTADLDLLSGGGTTLVDGFFALVSTDSILLSGTNTVTGSTRVGVNGEEADYDIGGGSWSLQQPLVPGLNRLFIGALDANGNVLASTEKLVVYQASQTSVGGALAGNVTWNPSMGIIHVTNDIIVPPGGSLTIDAGTVVLVAPGASILAGPDALIFVEGTDQDQVVMLPGNGRDVWGEIAADGSDSSLTMRHVETIAGAVKFRNGAYGLMEDCFVHDYKSGPIPIAGCQNAFSVTVRRCHFSIYHETLWRFSPIVVEDSLFENANNPSSDALDFDGAPPGAVIRRTTFRYGPQDNTDAIDLGSQTQATLVEDCLMHDFPNDKGISIGEDSFAIEIRNCLMYRCDSGVAVKDNCTAIISDCTITDCDYGFRNYNKANPASPTGGGHITNSYNNILWGNLLEISLLNSSTLVADHSDFGNTNWLGTGNILDDPLFVNAAARDYRLSAGSPAMGTGRDGADMGVKFPVGGIPSRPFNLGAGGLSTEAIQLTWEEDADNETGFVVERSDDAATWEVVGMAEANATSYVDDGLAANTAHYYRLRATNSSGNSRYSNVTKAATKVTETIVGGQLTENTVWTKAMGNILVVSNVTVPEGISLTVEPGVRIMITNGVSIRATAGGVIDLLGSAEDLITIQSMGAGNWGELSATGADSSLTIRFADITEGRVRFLAGSVGLLEDSHVHHNSASTPIINSVDAVSCTLRRTHVEVYYETLFQRTPMLIEECLFENPSADAVDFDGAPPGSIIRRTTFRNGPTGTNTDAVDLGPSAPTAVPVGVLVEDCVMYNFSDKGVSIGEIGTANSAGIIIRNCLIYNVGKGVQVKDTTIATIHDCTIIDSTIGVHGFFKQATNPGGGILTNYNNILYGNVDAIVTNDPPNATFITVNYTDAEGGIWDGIGNISDDPLFLNPAERDYRLAPNSPCRGTGLNGEDMGVEYPVGGVPAHPTNLQVVSTGSGMANLSWEDNSDNESAFRVQISEDGIIWMNLMDTAANATSASVADLVDGGTYYFRVRGVNFIDESLASNIAALGSDPNDLDGDGMPNDWETANGLNPNNPADATLDADNDGLNNRDEYLAGTDPRDAGSKLVLDAITFTGSNQIELQFTARADRAYRVEYRDALTEGAWQTLHTEDAQASERLVTVLDDLTPEVSSRFYRLVIP